MSSSGSQISSLPAPKPKVLKPMESRATFPTKINKSAHEIFFPYFCFIGHNRSLALSRLTLSGQELSGANR